MSATVRRLASGLLSMRTGLELITGAAGVTLLALGVRTWSGIVWRQERAAAVPPVSYATTIELPFEAHGLPSSTKWILLWPEANAAAICGVVERVGRSLQRSAVAIIEATDAGWTIGACTSQGQMPISRLEGIPADGFVVVDRSGRVMYGSRNLKDLETAVRTLAMLE